MKPSGLVLTAVLVSLPLAGRAQQKTETSPPTLEGVKIEKHTPQAPPAAPAASFDCLLMEADFAFNLKGYAIGDGKTVFLTTRDGNAFQLCVNGHQTVFFQGIPVKGKIGADGADLVVETVQPQSFVPADEVIAGAIKGDKFSVPGRPGYELHMRWQHRLALGRVTADAINGAGAGNGTVYGDQTAWVSIAQDVRTQEPRQALVSLAGTAPAQAVAAVRKALALPSLAKSSFADSASIEAIAAHLAKELPKYDGSGSPMVKRPAVSLNLWVKKDAPELDPVSVVSIAAAGKKTGVDVKGEAVIEAKFYDDLLYCYQKKRLETGSDHNAHLAGKK